MSENSPSASGSTAEGGGTRLPLQQVRPSGSQNSRRGDNPSSSATPFLRVAKSIKPIPPLMKTGTGIRNAMHPNVASVDPTAPNDALVAPSNTTDPNDDDTKMPAVPSTPGPASLPDMNSDNLAANQTSIPAAISGQQNEESRTSFMFKNTIFLLGTSPLLTIPLSNEPTPGQLSEYENERLKRIERNEAKLRSLGLLSSPEPPKPKVVRQKRDRSLAPREKKEDARKSVPPEKFVSYRDLPDNRGNKTKKKKKNPPPCSSTVGAPSYVPHGSDVVTSIASPVNPNLGAISLMPFCPSLETSVVPSRSSDFILTTEADVGKAGSGPLRAPSGTPCLLNAPTRVTTSSPMSASRMLSDGGTCSATTSPPLLATPTPPESESRTLSEGGTSRTWSNDAPLVDTNATAMIAPPGTLINCKSIPGSFNPTALSSIPCDLISWHFLRLFMQKRRKSRRLMRTLSSG
jgi:hypothetical protein